MRRDAMRCDEMRLLARSSIVPNFAPWSAMMSTLPQRGATPLMGFVIGRARAVPTTSTPLMGFVIGRARAVPTTSRKPWRSISGKIESLVAVEALRTGHLY